MTLAHAGHWIGTIVYLVPVIAFLGWLAFIMIRDRVKGRSGEPEQGAPGG